MKPIMLAFRPDTTDAPELFTHAVVPMYVYSDLLAVKDILEHELKPFHNVCAIDDDSQANRINLVALAEQLGFKSIELDEQISRNALSAEELEELKSRTSLPIGVTSTINPILDFLNAGARPSFICVECYNVMPDIDYLKMINPHTPVYGVVNIADPNNVSSESHVLKAWSEIIWSRLDGIWFWGWNTGVPLLDVKAQQNYPTLKQAVTQMRSEDQLRTAVAVAGALAVLGVGIMVAKKLGKKK